MQRGLLTGLVITAFGLASMARADVVPPTAPAATPVIVPQSNTVQQFDPAKGFPDHNGAFSAMLIVIPKTELSEFGSPPGSTRHLDRVARAEVGAQLAVKFVFVGMQTDPDGMANVTYDLMVTGPDGKMYGQSRYLGVRALKGKVDNVTGLFDNRQNVVLMQFEKGDMPGLYKITATLHDAVGKRDIPLTAGVELLPVAATVAAPAAPPATVAPASQPPVVSMAPIPNADTTTAATGKSRHRRHHKS